ncbi:MAG: sigma-70 family RNA polymerase sigma factor, partial [Bacteroidia bacterium]|nr:sigma-70 family RNA polymerase sigma factor [Bacteroidia bacterium]
MEKYHKNETELAGEQLLIKAAQADPACFDVLYNQYYRSVFVFIYKRTDDEELTADITSQVFLKALINIRKFQFRGVPFSAWLY